MISMIAGWLESAIRAAPEVSASLEAQLRTTAGAGPCIRHPALSCGAVPGLLPCLQRATGRAAAALDAQGSRLIIAIQILLWVSAVISGVLDNIPYTIGEDRACLPASHAWLAATARQAPESGATHGCVAHVALPCLAGRSYLGACARPICIKSVPRLPPAAVMVPVIEYLASAGLGLELAVSGKGAQIGSLSQSPRQRAAQLCARLGRAGWRCLALLA